MQLKLLSFLSLFFAGASAASPPVKVALRSSWPAPPFLLELLETISAESPDAFIPLLDRVTNQDILPSPEKLTPEALHQAVLQIALNEGFLSKQGSLASVEMNLALHSATPKIRAFYHHFTARAPAARPDGCGESWVDWYGETVCDIETLVQLAGHETIDPSNKTQLAESAYSRPKLLSFDHIYPSPERVLDRPARTAILYGTIPSTSFREFHAYLYSLAGAEQPHVEYVVRPVPPTYEGSTQRNHLSGFGVTLDLKKTDYLAVDDRQAKQTVLASDEDAEEEPVPPNVDIILDLLDQFPVNESAPDASVPLAPEELLELGQKATQLITTSTDPFGALKQLSQNFPKYAASLARRVPMNESISDELENNSENASPGVTVMWLNGVSVQEKDMSPLGLLRLLKKERDAVLSLVGTDLLANAGQAVELLTHEAVAETSGGKNPVDGLFDASDRPEGGDVIVWWNDIEKDSRYARWAPSLRQLLRPLYPGQFHQVRLNIFNIVLVADLSQMVTLNFFASPVANIIERFYPFRFGWVPAIDSEDGLKMANLVYHIIKVHGRKKALNFIKAVSQSDVPARHANMFIDWEVARTEFLKVIEPAESEEQKEGAITDFDAILRGDGVGLPVEKIEAYTKRLSATKETSLTGHGFVNGRHFPLDDNFLRNFQNEIGQQLQYLQEKVYKGKLTDENSSEVSTYFYDLPTTSSGRNEYIFPSSGSGALRISIPTLVEATNLRTDGKAFVYSEVLEGSNKPGYYPVTVYAIADLDSPAGISLIKEGLQAASLNEHAPPFRLSLIHNPADTEEDSLPERPPVSWFLSEIIQGNKLSNIGATKLLEAFESLSSEGSFSVGTNQLQELASGVALEKIDARHHRQTIKTGRLVGRALDFRPGQQGLIVNGRIIGPIDAGKFDAEDFSSVIQYEYKRRTQPIEQVVADFEPTPLVEGSGASHFLSTASSVISAVQIPDPSESGLFEAPQRPRTRPYKQLGNKYTGFEFGDNSTALYQLAILADPLSPRAQKWVSLVEWLSNIPDIFIDVRLNPKPLKEMPLKQFYRFNAQPTLQFDENGFEVNSQAIFEDLPLEPIYTLGVDVPNSWLVRPREALYDLDNIQLGNLAPEDKSLDATFDLDYIVVEGHARDTASNAPPRGVQLQLLGGDGKPVDDTQVVANLGYLQFKAIPGVFNLDIRPGRGRDIYTIESVGNEGWDSPTVEESGTEITVTSFEGLTLYPRLQRKPGMEDEDVLESTDDDEGGLFEDLTSRVFSLFKPKSQPEEQQAEINIFTVASGLLYERFASIMILSVLRNTNHTVKFWFIENFLSPSFLEFIPHFAEAYNFKYELVTYKWPSWLRAQTEKQRVIWAYKILFLDVLFPMDLKKVIFVDADQIVRADLKELVDLDLEGAPYGYTPMGDDNYDMEGFRFWKTGYWKDFLKGLPYHISALYVVDLVRFREMAAGDMLRGQYQQLSADPNSLANLDQDLPNNLQRQVPIFSLHEDWLWCETWCNKDRLDRAKTIDLCQNPLTKEPKLSRARQIPEWEEYDAEISRFTRKLAEEGRIHSRLAAADTTVLAGSKEPIDKPDSSTSEASESVQDSVVITDAEEDRPIDEL